MCKKDMFQNVELHEETAFSPLSSRERKSSTRKKKAFDNFTIVSQSYAVLPQDLIASGLWRELERVQYIPDRKVQSLVWRRQFISWKSYRRTDLSSLLRTVLLVPPFINLQNSFSISMETFYTNMTSQRTHFMAKKVYKRFTPMIKAW